MSSAAPSVSSLPSFAQERPAVRFPRFFESRENLLLLKRTLAAPVVKALEETARGAFFASRARLDVAYLDPSELLQSVSNPLARRFLAQDIESLARVFGAAMGRRHLHAQLEVLADDRCRKFHTDNVTVRLLCTYVGPGTQWVRNEDAVRGNLGRTDVDLETANRSVFRVPEAVRECTAGDVLLMKGEAFPGNRGFGVVHRSPPIIKRSLRRLVFKIDEHACGC